MNGDETYCFFGSSRCSEDDFIRSLNHSSFIQLNDIIYFDENGTAKSWAEWDPNCVPRSYLNPAYIVSVMPLIDDPRLKKHAGNKILNLPGSHSESG